MNRLLISLMLCFAFWSKASAQIYAEGDINKDGKIDVADVTRLAQKLINNEDIKTPEALISGTWKTADGKEMILNPDGTTEFDGASSFKYIANDSYLYLYNADKKIMKVYEVVNISSAYMTLKGITEEEETTYYNPFLIQHPVVEVVHDTIYIRNNYFPKTGDALEAIDLGLPSGKLWANMNVGANSPEEVGYYYAWGEKYRKSSYLSTNYVGDASVDIAKITHGDEWYVPSKADFSELVTYCESKGAEINGVSGILFTGYNGNSIFFPYNGFKDSSTTVRDSYCIYASSTIFKSTNYGSLIWCLYNNTVSYSYYNGAAYYYQKYFGYNYRAIRNKITSE